MENALSARPKTSWRSWDPMPGEDLVQMPRSLALDLVRLTGLTISGQDDDENGEFSPDLHEKRFEDHRERMGRIVNTLTAHIADEGLEPNPELVLRSLVMAYETSHDIQVGHVDSSQS